MKKLLIGCFLLLALSLAAQSPVPPAGGSGTLNTPYLINSLENLVWIAQNPSSWDKHFRQVSDIDALQSFTWPEGWLPIGSLATPFSGSYNGGCFLITNLMVNRLESYQGLFGVTSSSAIISNVQMENVLITGYSYVAGLVGLNYGQIINCHINAQLSIFFGGAGNYFGIVSAHNEGTISHSSSQGETYNPGGNYLGGFTGVNYGVVEDCWTQASVLGNDYLGGFTGNNYGNIRRSYSTGAVVSTGGSYFGGFTAIDYGTTEANFWDMESSSLNQSDGATGAYSYEMKDAFQYLAAGWDFVDEAENGEAEIWNINAFTNNGYPHHERILVLLEPVGLRLSVEGNHVRLSWYAVQGAIAYQVLSSDNPFEGFSIDQSGNYHNLSWTAPLLPHRFYKVIAWGE